MTLAELRELSETYSPCPFCGGKASLEIDSRGYSVHCTNYGCEFALVTTPHYEESWKAALMWERKQVLTYPF